MKNPSSSTVASTPGGSCPSVRVSRGTARKVNWPWTVTTWRPSCSVAVIFVRPSRCSETITATPTPRATPASAPKATTPATVAA
ncbi:hypothetical protein SMICM304S_08543 [Streptomyces microflavus]